MYRQSQSTSPQMPRLSSNDTPVTLTLLSANVLTFLLIYFSQSSWLVQGMALTANSARFPWTWLTWTLVGLMSPWGILCTCLWTWTVVGSMERAWGTQRLVRFFLATTLVTTATVLPALWFLFPDGILAGLSLAVAPITVAWCWINRQQTILFSYIFPVPALAIAAITVGFAFFHAGQSLGNPWAGFAGLSGCAAAWWWVRSGQEWAARRFGRHKETPNLRFADLDRDVRGGKPRTNPLQKAREEKQRKERDAKIAEMFRNSGFKDED